MPRGRKAKPDTSNPATMDAGNVTIAPMLEAPPYVTDWLTVKQGATRAGVTGQTLRNAMRSNNVFKDRAFATRLRDAFGNPTEYTGVYVDARAIDEWIAERTDPNRRKRAGRATDGKKRYTLRLTGDQYNAYLNGDYETAFNGVELETTTRKPRTKTTIETPSSDGNGNGAETGDLTTDDLFDVEMTEA